MWQLVILNLFMQHYVMISPLYFRLVPKTNLQR